MGELAVVRKRQIRLPVGLLLSIGAQKPDRGPGRAIDFFRPKEGQLQQYAAEAKRFIEVYGEDPKELRDLHFLSDEVPAVLDVRLLAFSQSGIRGVGDTNFAEISDESEFEDRVFGGQAYVDGFTFFPKDVSEVRPEDRAGWEGEPVHGELTGRADARVERLQIKYVTSLEFCLPEIMGLGKVARISTSGRASTRNLYKALWTEWSAFGGHLVGVPFRLALRPRATQRFESAEKKYVQTTVYELVIDTPHTVSELRAAIAEHRKAFGSPDRERLRLEGRALQQALALPPASGEEHVREEPVAEVPDWLRNKIAHLEGELPEDARRAVLLGVFGVESSAALDPEQAERYWRVLEQALPAEAVEGEIVDDGPNGDDDQDAAEEATATASDETPYGGADAVPSAEQSGVESGPTHTRQERDWATDAPAPSAPDDLPGEPVEGVDPVEAAGDMTVPIGAAARQGRVLRDMPDNWLEYALNNGRYFADHREFYDGLELWVRHHRPKIWEAARG